MKYLLSPPVDVLDDEKEIVVDMDLPGFVAEDVDISVENGTLTIKGERKVEKESKGKLVKTERRHGYFSRAFSLPDNVDEEKVLAKFSDGVLRITIPKVTKALPKKIKISIE